MSGRRFRFVSTWVIAAPRGAVYARLIEIGALSSFWSGMRSTLLADGEAVVGREARLEVKGLLPVHFRTDVRIVSVRPNEQIDVVASGDLVGTGSWRLSDSPRGTTARFEWNVTLEHRWLGPLARWLRPLLIASHDVAMRRGERGLKKLLEDARVSNRSARFA
jgi:hypothetical protein